MYVVKFRKVRMDKRIILMFLCMLFLLTGCMTQTKAKQVVNSNELTLMQAVKVAYPTALRWNRRAKLFFITSKDNSFKDPNRFQSGRDGKRKYWNIQFGVPDSNKLFLVTVHNGKVDETANLTDKEGPKQPKIDFVLRLSDIRYDSPELLKQAKKIVSIYPGREFANGYHFGLFKDTQSGDVVISVIGWDKGRKKMKHVFFNGATGKPIQPNLKE